MPSLHTLEEGKIWTPNSKQSILAVSAPGDQRVKGVAGTGKTTLLAHKACLLYTSPSPRDRTRSRMPSSA